MKLENKLLFLFRAREKVQKLKSFDPCIRNEYFPKFVLGFASFRTEVCIFPYLGVRKEGYTLFFNLSFKNYKANTLLPNKNCLRGVFRENRMRSHVDFKKSKSRILKSRNENRNNLSLNCQGPHFEVI